MLEKRDGRGVRDDDDDTDFGGFERKDFGRSSSHVKASFRVLFRDKGWKRVNNGFVLMLLLATSTSFHVILGVLVV